ncbi:bifunctional diaminohydroxyphosphoribosylaminopyrimidine deaminase/5-amino-6-(5-phosphoribosylamino)uracil reductase RibD [Methyloglobulus sp.]|uniref:bifunctional diaminohydroxyphosphoribosylaminopyrimidine deaminase/5-amino-6-(5-phosphoribosylamino)uracil reductase RibD n=1 Tax=Methyloglobulus sp. TaxID=2518622 RepID=UPI0032B7860D
MEQAALDAKYMARAIQLARKGLYTTDPNPRVGCVLVKDGRIIGEGWHKRAGLAHAEVEALTDAANATETTNGATAYVTLEPCSHHGRTPPCCETLVKAGIKRVVAAMQDPNPRVSGNGFAYLKAVGIEVSCGVLQEDARVLNRGFIMRMTENRPFVRSKLAMSLDGRTAMASGESQWITSPEARADVHKLRAESSAILTGINTVLADDPSLTARIDKEVVQPIRVVLDSSLKMPLTAQMLTLPGRTLILTCNNHNSVRLYAPEGTELAPLALPSVVEGHKDKPQQLQNAGAEVYQLPEKQGQLDLAEVMKFLAEQEINEVLVEAGAVLNGALLAENLVDEWVIYMAPKILGDQGRGLFHMPRLDKLADCKIMKFKDIRQVGKDIKITLIKVDPK